MSESGETNRKEIDENLLLTILEAFAIIKNGDCASVSESAAVAQSVERHIGNVEVTSSILVSSFFIFSI